MNDFAGWDDDAGLSSVEDLLAALDASGQLPATVNMSGQACMTYRERYRLPEDGKSAPLPPGLNANHPEARFAVLVGLPMELLIRGAPEDLITHLRALAHELTSTPHNAYHFHLALQNPEDPQEAGGLHLDHHEEMLELLPNDLHQFVFQHSFSEGHPGLDPAASKEKGLKAKYLGVARFLDFFPGYEYVWILEHNFRYTGENLGHYLNAAANLAVDTMQEELDNGPSWSIDAEAAALPDEDMPRFVSTEAAAQPDTRIALGDLPDLLSLGAFDLTEERHPGETSQDALACGSTLLMGSRRLFRVLREGQQLAQGRDLEGFIRLVMYRERLSSVAVPTSMPGCSEGLAGHCCNTQGAALYASWFQARQECLPAHVLHPISNEEDFWPKVPGRATSYV